MGIMLQRLAQKIVDGGNGLDAGKTSAGDGESEQLFRWQGRALEIGFFEMFDEPVAQIDRVGERLHRQRVLFETWDGVEVSHRTEGEHEMVVVKLMGMACVDAVGNHNALVRQIDGSYFAVEKVWAVKHLADRVDDGGEVEVAGW